MSLRRELPGRLARTCLLLCLAALDACTLRTQVDALGTAPPTATGLWVTVDQVWLTTSTSALPEVATSWVRHTLATPVTLNLAAITPGTIEALATGIALPAGEYRQLHLVVEDASTALTTAAQSAGLTYNAQISNTDTTGVVTISPLELPAPGGGLTIPIDLTLNNSLSTELSPASSSTATTPAESIATFIDGARDVLTLSYGATTAYLLSPVTRAANESLSGAISGTIDTSALPAGYPPITVSAQVPDTSNTHHVVVQRSVVAANGSFSLYPLPAPKSGSASYDLVISGAGAQTVIVQGVTVKAASITAPTVVQSTPITLATATTVYADVTPLAASSLPGGARVDFYQPTGAGSALPYLIDGTAVDPVSHRLPGDAFALSAGSITVGGYNGGGSIGFTQAAGQTPGSYTIGTEGLYRADVLAAFPLAINGSLAAPTPIAPPAGTLTAGNSAALRVTLAAPLGVYDTGLLLVSSGNRIVESANVGLTLSQGGGTITLTLPTGTATGSLPYQVSLRAWNSVNVTGTLTKLVAPSSALLGPGGPATISLQLQ